MLNILIVIAPWQLKDKVSDKRMLRKYIKIWRKSSLINKENDSEIVYGNSDKLIKTITNSYGDKAITNFQGEEEKKRHYTNACH